MDNQLSRIDYIRELIEDCRYYKSIVSDCNIDDNDENFPLYMYAVKYIDTKNIEIDIDEWLTHFKETAFIEIDSDKNNDFSSNTTIILKQNEIIKNITNFVNKGEDENAI